MNVFESHDGFAAIAGMPSTLMFGNPLDSCPVVSIMIPTYRRQDLLKEAIASALGQQGAVPFEVVVVDNDAEAPDVNITEQVIRSFKDPRLMYYRNGVNLGMTGNWNRCIQLARGKWYTLLHDDDWLAPRFLHQMMKYRPEDADHFACASEWGGRSYDPDYRFPVTPHLRRVTRVGLGRLSYNNVTGAPGILCLRSAAIEAGGYQDAWYPCADYAFNTLMANRYHSYFLHERQAYYRYTHSQTFKGDTLYKIMCQSEIIRRNILGKTNAISVRLISFAASVWWCRFGSGRGLEVKGVFKERPWVLKLATSRILTNTLRLMAYLLVRVH